MESARPEQVNDQTAAATLGQVLDIEDFAKLALAQRTGKTVLTRTCPHCQCNDIMLHGKDQNRRQRFKCRGCCKTYNILTGTPMARARKPEKWDHYLACMTEHMALRKVVATGIGVHLVTAWRWRHRFLHAAANDNAAVLSGMVEADTTSFQWSDKGSRSGKKARPLENRAVRARPWGATKRGRLQVPVLTALDDRGAIFEAILASPDGIKAALDGRIAKGSVLFSDGNAAYIAVADKANVEHRPSLVSTASPQDFGINPVVMGLPQLERQELRRVKFYHQRLKYLINERCRGVATKYLGNYLGWHRAMSQSGFEGRMLLTKALA